VHSRLPIFRLTGACCVKMIREYCQGVSQSEPLTVSGKRILTSVTETDMECVCRVLKKSGASEVTLSFTHPENLQGIQSYLISVTYVQASDDEAFLFEVLKSKRYCIRTHTHPHSHTHTRMRTRTTRTHINAYMHRRVHSRAYMRVHTCTPAHTYTHTLAHTRSHRHTRTQTFTRL